MSCRSSCDCVCQAISSSFCSLHQQFCQCKPAATLEVKHCLAVRDATVSAKQSLLHSAVYISYSVNASQPPQKKSQQHTVVTLHTNAYTFFTYSDTSYFSTLTDKQMLRSIFKIFDFLIKQMCSIIMLNSLSAANNLRN